MRSYGFELTQKPARPQATAAQQTLTQNLTQQVDSLKDALADLNWLAQNAEEHRNLSVQLDARQLDSRSLDVLLRDFERAQALTLKGDRIQFASEAMRDFVKGGWLELHVIQAVHEVTGSLNIRDKAMGLEVQDQATQTRNELDIAFMARNRLFVIECKTARIDKPQGNSDRAAPPKAKDLDKEVNAVVREAAQKHSRVIFNGNGYSEDWVTEAAKRGLPNIKSTIEALKALANDNAVALFEKYKVLSGRELHSRYEIGLEQYAKHINIEARCAIAMTKNEYIPAVIEFTRFLAETINQVKTAGGEAKVQSALLGDVSGLLASASKKLAALESALDRANGAEDLETKAAAFRDSVFSAQVELRKDIDALEAILPRDLWPVPTYAEMLFNF